MYLAYPNRLIILISRPIGIEFKFSFRAAMYAAHVLVPLTELICIISDGQRHFGSL